MEFIFWIIFVIFVATQQISGLHIKNQLADFSSTLMSTPAAQSNSHSKFCRIGEKQETFDRFLSEAFRICYTILISGREIENNSITINHFNRSQMENTCKSFNNNEGCVERLETCFENASSCCRKQLREMSNSTENFCPITWDGYLCFDSVAENSTIAKFCPKFIPRLLYEQFAERRCTRLALNSSSFNQSNLTWEKTSYANCFINTENEIIIIEIKRYFLIISLFFLFVSILIFVSFRSLRSQQRIKVHINLFISLFLRVVFDLTMTINSYSKIKQDVAFNFSLDETCHWLIIFLKYFQNSTFSWMLCEALLLHQLLFFTFEQITNVKKYLIIGWCVPLSYNLIYFFIRRFHPYYKTKRNFCGDKEPDLEYLIRIPNILFLLVNILFLVNIIRLIQNLPTQPNDRSYWKRTFKAVTILVPLFGIQLLLVAVTLEDSNKFYLIYTVIQTILQDSQGMAVALAFCAFNQEVHNILKQKFSFVKCDSNIRFRSSSQTNRVMGRKHESLMSRMRQHSSNSLPLSIRDSIENPFKISLLEPIKNCDKSNIKI